LLFKCIQFFFKFCNVSPTLVNVSLYQLHLLVDNIYLALAELQSTVEELQGWQGKAAALEGELKDARQDAEQVRSGLASATERAGQAEARAVEIERRADGLQAELGRVHEDAKAEPIRSPVEWARADGDFVHQCPTDAIHLQEREDVGWQVLPPDSQWQGVVEYRWQTN